MTSGDVEPIGAGAWMTTKDGERATGIKWKTLYRQAKRGRRAWREDGERDVLLVWIKDEEHRHLDVPLPEKTEEIAEESRENPPGGRGLPVPSQREQFLALLNEATASMGQQIERLTGEREQALRERDRLAAHLADAQAERDHWKAAHDTLKRRRWWKPWG